MPKIEGEIRRSDYDEITTYVMMNPSCSMINTPFAATRGAEMKLPSFDGKAGKLPYSFRRVLTSSNASVTQTSGYLCYRLHTSQTPR
jgi:hypothetical protein